MSDCCSAPSYMNLGRVLNRSTACWEFKEKCRTCGNIKTTYIVYAERQSLYPEMFEDYKDITKSDKDITEEE